MGENLNLDQQERGCRVYFQWHALFFYHPHPGKVERVPSSSFFFPKDVSNFRQAIILIMYANPT